MSDATESSSVPAKNRRLAEFLRKLAKQGAKQQEIARRLNVPPSYLSDVKLGRKTLSDTFARAFCSEFDVGLDWLLDGTGSQVRPQVEAAPSPSGPVLIPIFYQPVEGDPQGVKTWDGSRVELSGAAATRALRGQHPYVLRSPIDDKLGRIRRNDLILVDQNTVEPTSVVVVRDRDKSHLARQSEQGYRSVESGRVMRGKPNVIGVCLGIVWASL